MTPDKQTPETQPPVQKPSFAEWLYWAQVTIDRLTSIIHVYTKPPHDDVYMADQERQFKAGQAIETLRRLYAITDEDEIARPRRGGSERYHALVITNLQPVLREILRRMPAWSGDMQYLLKSPWKDNHNGKAARILFAGPARREAEGIGTGMPENGRLPEVLHTMLERETLGETRDTHEAKYGDVMAKRNKVARSWSQQNASFLRSAGRVN
jgi:hypothetical protein